MSTKKLQHVKPHSRTFSLGAVGKLDGRSAQARFLKTVESELLQGVGPAPSVGQRILAARAARALFRLQLIDEKLDAGGEMSIADSKVYGAMNNAARLCIRELNLRGTKAPKITLADIAARHKDATPKP